MTEGMPGQGSGAKGRGESKAAVRAVALLMALAIAPIPEVVAQTVVAVQSGSAPMLHITILEGEEALNNIRERTAREPIVQVEDSNHKPVAGVAVVFTSLRGTNGAGGTFNQVTSYRTVTDQSGRATGKGFQPNTTVGEFSVQVEATLGASVATAVIHEINTLKGGGGGGREYKSRAGRDAFGDWRFGGGDGGEVSALREPGSEVGGGGGGDGGGGSRGGGCDEDQYGGDDLKRRRHGNGASLAWGSETLVWLPGSRRTVQGIMAALVCCILRSGISLL